MTHQDDFNFTKEVAEKGLDAIPEMMRRERALAATLPEMYVQGISTRKGKPATRE